MQQVSTTVDVEFGRLHAASWTSAGADQHCMLTKTDAETVVYVVADANLGPFGDNICVTVPFVDLAEFVHRVEDAGKDGFVDAVDHLPPRGRSIPYLDAYGAGEFEARGRSE